MSSRLSKTVLLLLWTAIDFRFHNLQKPYATWGYH